MWSLFLHLIFLIYIFLCVIVTSQWFVKYVNNSNDSFIFTSFFYMVWLFRLFRHPNFTSSHIIHTTLHTFHAFFMHLSRKPTASMVHKNSFFIFYFHFSTKQGVRVRHELKLCISSWNQVLIRPWERFSYQTDPRTQARLQTDTLYTRLNCCGQLCQWSGLI